MAAAEERTAPFAQDRGGGDRVGSLVPGVDLAGERGLVDLKRLGDEHPAVGRHDVAGVEHQDVAGHDAVGIDRTGLAVAQHVAPHGDLGQQPGDRPRGLVLLPPAQQSAEHHDRQDDRGVEDVAEQHRQAGGDQQDQHGGLAEPADQRAQRPGALGSAQVVRAVRRPPPLGLHGAEAGGRRVDRGERLLGGGCPEPRSPRRRPPTLSHVLERYSGLLAQSRRAEG